MVAGCWVGGEDRDIHFRLMSDGQGASMALPVWGLFMNKVYKDKGLGYLQSETFTIPLEFNPCQDRLSESETVEEESELDNAFLDR